VDDDGDVAGGQLGGDALFIAAGGFEDDELNGVRFEDGEEFADAGHGVRQGMSECEGSEVDIERLLGNVDAHKDRMLRVRSRSGQEEPILANAGTGVKPAQATVRVRRPKPRADPGSPTVLDTQGRNGHARGGWIYKAWAARE
jgi:hypothetical protein